MIVSKKNYYLNYYKCIACFGVVFMHVKLPHYILDGMIQSCFRFAIPLFFMISGYYAYYEESEKVQKKLPTKIKNILKVSLIGCVYYLFFQIAIGLFGDSHGSWISVVERLKEIFTFQKLVELLVFNQDPFIKIMWFTFALLYCYIALYFINKYNIYRYIYILIPFFIAGNLFLGNVLALYGIDVVSIYYRNFLLYGIPFFMLGNLLHKYHDRVVSRFSNALCLTMIFTGLLLSVSEWFVFGRQELYFGSLLLVSGTFMHTLLHPEWKENSPLTIVGERYSLFIYIVHYSFIIILDRLVSRIFNIDSTIYLIYQYVKPLLIFLMCIIAAYVFYTSVGFLRRKIGNMNHERRGVRMEIHDENR